MAGLNGVKIKLMPDSPNVNLKEIEEEERKQNLYELIENIQLSQLLLD